MSERRRIATFSILVMVCVATSVAGISIAFLYRTAFAERCAHLEEMALVHGQAMQSALAFDAVHARKQPGCETAAFHLAVSTQPAFRGFGKTGELIYGRRVGDRIVFIQGDSSVQGGRSAEVLWESRLAEPIRCALQGRSGTLIGLDYRGTDVLAAYKPVGNSGFGVVAKVDLAEIRQPFVEAGIVTGISSLVIILAGALLMFRASHPLIRRVEVCRTRTRTKNQKLRTQEARLEALRGHLEEARADADVAARAKREFLANISHEIRTPMTAILGFSENLLDPHMTPSDRLDAVNTIHRNGWYLLSIINNVLDLAKLEAEQLDVQHILCSPWGVVADADYMARGYAELKGLAFDVECVGVIPEKIRTDPTRLRQILVNLVGNAIKFTDAGAVRLVVRLVDDLEGPMMQFDVIDTGIGMSAEQAASLFEPLDQLDSTMTRKFGGVGVGLAVSKRLAKMLGGDVVVVETAEGLGTRFRATVAAGPLDGVKMLEHPLFLGGQKENGVSTDRIGAHVDEGQLAGWRILFAEDGPDNQRLVSYLLQKAGASVTVAENGKLALEAALAAEEAGCPYDVILMDMQMPVMDGCAATALLREKGYRRPIIALTANTLASDREKCMSAGCNDFATKPVDRSTLISIIRGPGRLSGGSRGGALPADNGGRRHSDTLSRLTIPEGLSA